MTELLRGFPDGFFRPFSCIRRQTSPAVSGKSRPARRCSSAADQPSHRTRMGRCLACGELAARDLGAPLDGERGRCVPERCRNGSSHLDSTGDPPPVPGAREPPPACPFFRCSPMLSSGAMRYDLPKARLGRRDARARRALRFTAAADQAGAAKPAPNAPFIHAVALALCSRPARRCAPALSLKRIAAGTAWTSAAEGRAWAFATHAACRGRHRPLGLPGPAPSWAPAVASGELAELSTATTNDGRGYASAWLASYLDVDRFQAFDVRAVGNTPPQALVGRRGDRDRRASGSGCSSDPRNPRPFWSKRSMTRSSGAPWTIGVKLSIAKPRAERRA